MEGKIIRIAIIPVKRDYTDVHAAAQTRDLMMKTIAQLKLATTEFVHIDEVASHGVLYEVNEIQQVADHLRTRHVDALFFLHCDFGCEEVIGRLARQFDIPVLLWGPRDRPSKEKPMGREVQCGIFASTRLLKRMDVPFTYIVNSDVDSTTFSEGFENFQRVVSVVKAFKNLRILQIGLRPKPFWSVMYNESELLKRFGVEVVPVSDSYIKELSRKMVLEQKDLIAEELANLDTRMNTCNIKKEKLELAVASKLVLKKLAEENQISGIAYDCWNMRSLGCNSCLTVGELTDIGLPVSCETDMLGVITSILLQAAMNHEQPTFFADLTIRHPDNENAELLWHCGPFPYSLKHPDVEAMVGENATGEWRMKDGPITVARLGEDGGQYKLFVGEGHSTDGPEVFGTYVWMEVDNWPEWEKKLVYGPYIHHVTGIFSHCSVVLAEAIKYMKGIEFDPA
jgi:L-fucose isomerase-like protein